MGGLKFGTKNHKGGSEIWDKSNMTVVGGEQKFNLIQKIMKGCVKKGRSQRDVICEHPLNIKINLQKMFNCT